LLLLFGFDYSYTLLAVWFTTHTHTHTHTHVGWVIYSSHTHYTRTHPHTHTHTRLHTHTHTFTHAHVGYGWLHGLRCWLLLHTPRFGCCLVTFTLLLLFVGCYAVAARRTHACTRASSTASTISMPPRNITIFIKHAYRRPPFDAHSLRRVPSHDAYSSYDAVRGNVACKRRQRRTCDVTWRRGALCLLAALGLLAFVAAYASFFRNAPDVFSRSRTASTLQRGDNILSRQRALPAAPPFAIA